jgi:hypothetical protein
VSPAINMFYKRFANATAGCLTATAGQLAALMQDAGSGHQQMCPRRRGRTSNAASRPSGPSGARAAGRRPLALVFRCFLHVGCGGLRVRARMSTHVTLHAECAIAAGRRALVSWTASARNNRRRQADATHDARRYGCTHGSARAFNLTPTALRHALRTLRLLGRVKPLPQYWHSYLDDEAGPSYVFGAAGSAISVLRASWGTPRG